MEYVFSLPSLVAALSCVAFVSSLILLKATISGKSLPGCGPGSSCDEVTTSRWSRLGPIPTTVPGTALYLAMLAGAVIVAVPGSAHFTSAELAHRAATSLGFCSLLAAGAAVWFTALQALVIQKFCRYCMATHLSALAAAAITLSVEPPSQTIFIAAVALLGLFIIGQIAIVPKMYAIVEATDDDNAPGADEGGAGATTGVSDDRSDAVPMPVSAPLSSQSSATQYTQEIGVESTLAPVPIEPVAQELAPAVVLESSEPVEVDVRAAAVVAEQEIQPEPAGVEPAPEAVLEQSMPQPVEPDVQGAAAATEPETQPESVGVDVALETVHEQVQSEAVEPEVQPAVAATAPVGVDREPETVREQVPSEPVETEAQRALVATDPETQPEHVGVDVEPEAGSQQAMAEPEVQPAVATDPETQPEPVSVDMEPEAAPEQAMAESAEPAVQSVAATESETEPESVDVDVEPEMAREQAPSEPVEPEPQPAAAMEQEPQPEPVGIEPEPQARPQESLFEPASIPAAMDAPPPVAPAEQAIQPDAQPVVATATDKPPRRIHAIGKKVSLSPHLWPILGNRDATNIIIEQFDYTCHFCRDLHNLLLKAIEAHPADLAVLMMPVPMDMACNPMMKATPPEHVNACVYARYAMAVFRAAPEKFAELDEWLFQPTRPWDLELTKMKAESLAGGPEKLAAALEDPWMAKRHNEALAIYNAASQGQLPKMLFERAVVSGPIPSYEQLQGVFEKVRLFNPPPANPQ